MELTKENTKVILNENKKGVTIIRKNFKKRTLVEIRGKRNFLITKYRFDNIDLKYKTKYMNWANLDCCGGWAYDKEDLINQFKNDKKLFADVVLSFYENVDAHFLPLIEECSKLDGAKVIEVEHWSENCRKFILVKEGCVSDYLDVDAIIENYYDLGLWKLSDDQLQHLKDMANKDMSCYITKNHNKYNYDFINPEGLIEFIFTGMLLGYPVESTADRLGL